MAGSPTGKLVGIGTIRDLTNGKRFDSQQEIKFGAEFTEVELPDGDFLNSYWAFPNGFTGSVGFHDISADTIALALGGTVTAADGRDEEVEAITVPAAPGPYTVTLVNGANCIEAAGIVDGDVVLIEPITNRPIKCKVVAIAPAASGEVQVVHVAGVSTTLTFNVADAEKIGVCAYPVKNVLGNLIDLDPSSMPGAFRFFASMGLYYDEDAIGRLTIDCQQAVWSGRFELGETRLAHDAIIRDIRFNNRYPGALKVYTSF